MPRRSTPALSSVRRAKTKSRVSMPRFRVVRLTMLMALLMCSVKVVDVYQGGKQLQLQWQQAYAEDEAPKAMKKDDDAMQDMAGNKEMNAMDDTMAGKKEMAKPEGSEEETLERARSFSQIELDLLQSLRERRDELEEKKRELDLKEKLLEGTELRINDKIAEMKALEKKVSMLLERYSGQEESHIRSLVKIYENMKPKSAAVIFNELELPILLEVIDEMSERKVAPVLAAMDPMKAKEVTSDLAAMRKLEADRPGAN